MITPRYGFGIWQLNETPFAEHDPPDQLPDGTVNDTGKSLNGNWRIAETQLWNIHEGLGMNLQSVKPFTEDYGLWVFDDTGETKKALMLEGIDEVRLVVSSDILATQAYVDALIQSAKRKDNCTVATIGNITLSGEQTIDDILTSTDRVLVWEQTDAKENGIYVSASGAWVRSDDANTGQEILGALVKILQGTVHEGEQFNNSNPSVPVLGTDDITFVNLGSIITHNDTRTKQGGQANEYYHLKTAQHTALTDFSDSANEQLAQLNSLGSPTFNDIDLTGELRLDNNKPLYLDTANTKSLKWNPTNSRFEFNDNMFAATVFGVEAYFDEILYLGHSTTNAGEIDFWNGETAYDKILKYDDVNSRFDFNDSLKVNGYLLMTAELSCIGADFGNDEITGILNVDAVNGAFSGQLDITGNQKFGDDKKLYFGTDDDVEMFWDSSNSWGNIFATDFWILDSSAWNYYFGMSASGIQSRFNAGAGVGNWSEYWLSKSNTFIDFFYGGGSSSGAAGLKRLGFYGTKDTAKDYRLKLWDEDNDTYFQLGRVSGIWESNADIAIIDAAKGIKLLDASTGKYWRVTLSQDDAGNLITTKIP